MTNSAPGETEPLLLSVKAAALVLGLSEWQVKGLTGDGGSLPSTKIGNRRYIPASALRQYAEDIAKSA